MEAQRLALAHEADVQVGEPDGEGKQHQEQQQLELLPDLLHREPQHPPGSIPGGRGGGLELEGSLLLLPLPPEGWW